MNENKWQFWFKAPKAVKIALIVFTVFMIVLYFLARS